jgi:hypothetical protein
MTGWAKFCDGSVYLQEHPDRSWWGQVAVVVVEASIVMLSAVAVVEEPLAWLRRIPWLSKGSS